MKKEDVYAVLEYALNRLLAFIQPTDLLVIDSWQVVYRIEDPSKTNIQKCWLAPLPDFDHESFPFVITSGAESYNIVNVKEGLMNPIVYSPGSHCVAQEAGFFVNEENGISLHFATSLTNSAK